MKIGQKVTVKVTSIDPQGRINLTMKKLNKLDNDENEQENDEIEAKGKSIKDNFEETNIDEEV